MAEILQLESRQRFVTKGVMGKVDNITQHFIWTRIVDKVKIKADDLLEMTLKVCEPCKSQAVMVKGTFENDGELNDCWPAPELCEEELLVFYDPGKRAEYMMLRSEADNLANER